MALTHKREATSRRFYIRLVLLCFCYLVYSRWTANTTENLDYFSLNYDTCLHIQVEQYGRTGNNIVQLENVLRVLGVCTGGASVEWDSSGSPLDIPDMFDTFGERVLPGIQKLVHQHCRPLKIGRALFHGSRHDLANTISQQSDVCKVSGNDLTTRKRHFYAQKFLAIDNAAMQIDINSSAVAHMRGGDVFSRLGNISQIAWYHQPPCDFYFKAFQHSNYSTLYIVTEDNWNPCVTIISDLYKFTPKKIIVLNDTTPAFALTLLRRTNALITSRSTFSRIAEKFYLGSDENRVVYTANIGETGYPYSHMHCDIVYGLDNLRPWEGSEAQVTIVKTRKVRMTKCIKRKPSYT